MTHAEATTLVTMLFVAYPDARVGKETAAVYEAAIADLDAEEVQAALKELIYTSRKLPVVADIRGEVMRARAAKNTAPVKPWLSKQLPYVPMHERQTWTETLSRLLESGARHQRMAQAWYAERGKAPPADPARGHVARAAAGAAGRRVDFNLRDYEADRV